jgi:hypothetical protein
MSASLATAERIDSRPIVLQAAKPRNSRRFGNEVLVDERGGRPIFPISAGAHLPAGPPLESAALSRRTPEADICNRRNRGNGRTLAGRSVVPRMLVGSRPSRGSSRGGG